MFVGMTKKLSYYWINKGAFKKNGFKILAIKWGIYELYGDT